MSLRPSRSSHPAPVSPSVPLPPGITLSHALPLPQGTALTRNMRANSFSRNSTAALARFKRHTTGFLHIPPGFADAQLPSPKLDLAREPLGMPSDANFHDIFIAKVEFCRHPDSSALLDRLSRDRCISEFQGLDREGSLRYIDVHCHDCLMELILNLLFNRHVQFPDEIQTSGYTSPMLDPRWPSTSVMYELLHSLLSYFPESSVFGMRWIKQLMVFSQSGDPRERLVITTILKEYYLKKPGDRSDFLYVLFHRLLELHELMLTPFAGGVLLNILSHVIELDFGSHIDEFKTLVERSVIPLVSYHYLNLVLVPLLSIFKTFMLHFPAAGVLILREIQNAFPYTSKAGWAARAAISVFTSLNQRFAQQIAPHFFAFVADCLRSMDTILVLVVLGIFERPDTLKPVYDYIMIALPLLVGPLIAVRETGWNVNAREKAAAALKVLSEASPTMFEEVRVGNERAAENDQAEDQFVLNWGKVAEFAGMSKNQITEKAGAVQKRSHAIGALGVARILSVKDREFIPGFSLDSSRVALHHVKSFDVSMNAKTCTPILKSAVIASLKVTTG